MQQLLYAALVCAGKIQTTALHCPRLDAPSNARQIEWAGNLVA
jgi:hypothetical protein